MTTKDLVKTALLTAVMAIIAPICLPIGPIPISLATFAIYAIAASNKTKHSVTATFLYIALGAIGLPVFASYSAGFSSIAGPTGGYIISYLFMALIISSITSKGKISFMKCFSADISATIACYALGTAWFMAQTSASLAYSLSVCVVPFLVFDGIKIIVASMLGPRLKKIADRYR